MTVEPVHSIEVSLRSTLRILADAAALCDTGYIDTTAYREKGPG